MKTPEQIAKEVDELRYIENYRNSRDINGSGFRQAIAREAIRRDRAQRDAPLIDSLSCVDESTDGRMIAARIMAYLKGDPNWESVEIEVDDDDYQVCDSCGDSVHTLSTDGLCDGCVAEREPVPMKADDLKPGHVFRHSYMRSDHLVKVERTYRYTPGRGILRGAPMLGIIYATAQGTGTMRLGRSDTVWVDRGSINEEGQ